MTNRKFFSWIQSVSCLGTLLFGSNGSILADLPRIDKSFFAADYQKKVAALIGTDGNSSIMMHIVTHDWFALHQRERTLSLTRAILVFAVSTRWYGHLGASVGHEGILSNAT